MPNQRHPVVTGWIDWVRRLEGLEDLTEDHIRLQQSILAETQADFRSAILSHDPGRLRRPMMIANSFADSAFPALRSGFRRLGREINEQNRALAASAAEATVENLGVTLGADISNITIAQVGAVGHSVKSLPDRFFDRVVDNTLIFGETATGAMGRLSSTALSRLRRQMVSAISSGTTIDQMTDDLGDILKTTSHQAETIARTSGSAIVHNARREVLNSFADVIGGYLVVATLDRRTSNICQARGGDRYDADYNPVDGAAPYQNGPPFHYRCRSTVVALPGDPRNYRRSIRQKTSLTRQGIDGPVPRSWEYQDLIDRSTPRELVRQYGDQQAEMLYTGRIKTSDFLDKLGRPRSPAELIRIGRRRRPKRAWDVDGDPIDDGASDDLTILEM